MNKTLFILLLLSLVGSSITCKKAIPSNVITTVKGFVIDTVKNKRLSNATVIIEGCGEANFRTFCTDSLTSTKTNTNGELDISFRGNGHSTGYEASVVTDENYDYSTFIRLKPGESNNIILYAREKNYLKANIKILNNPFDTLVVLSAGSTKHIIYGRTSDTLLYFRVLPNALNLMVFSAFDKSVGRFRRLLDTLQITMLDTTIYSKIIPNVQLFPLN